MQHIHYIWDRPDENFKYQMFYGKVLIKVTHFNDEEMYFKIQKIINIKLTKSTNKTNLAGYEFFLDKKTFEQQCYPSTDPNCVLKEIL